ncbi:MAG: hypothetical protein IJU50_08280 [Lachnospiraceae bacterium]|nr:hypothetical protein [Lachnospiraceae bacterium]
MDIIEFYTEEYRSGQLDVALPDEITLWRERAESARFVLKGIILEKDRLLAECKGYTRLLEKHGIEC